MWNVLSETVHKHVYTVNKQALIKRTDWCSNNSNGPITIAIRARFDYDSATTRYEMSTIRLRFERDTTSYEELCAFEQ